jgi:hypothetical protein
MQAHLSLLRRPIMPKRRRNSLSLTKAERRLEGLRAVNPALNFGNGLSVSAYSTMIEDVREKLAAYNMALSMVDKTQNALNEAERSLNDFSEHMLLSVASKYGKSSDEYEMAGGTRKASRRRSHSLSATEENSVAS